MRGGEEQLVVQLIGAGQVQAREVAEPMREAVSRPGLHSNNGPVAISISGGVTEFHDRDEIEAVFQRA